MLAHSRLFHVSLSAIAVDLGGVCLKLWREVFLMLVAQVAELVLHAMAGMCCGLARSLLRLRCVVAQGPVSHVPSVLLMMVAALVGVLFDWAVGDYLHQCALPAGRPVRLL